MKKAFLGLALVAFVAASTFAGDGKKDGGKCCSKETASCCKDKKSCSSETSAKASTTKTTKKTTKA